MGMEKIFDLKAALIDDIREFKAPGLACFILDKHLEDELINYCLNEDSLLSSRAMWVLGHCTDIEFDRFIPYHEILINNLNKPNLHDGVIRNTLRLFLIHPVPEKHQAFMLDNCYNYVKDPSVAIAIRAFAIAVIFNISKPYPELLLELEQVLNLLPLEDESPGMRSKIRNVLKAIAKIKQKNYR